MRRYAASSRSNSTQGSMSPKDRKSLRIVHSLEPLNHVTIKHTGVTPFTDQIGEHFARHACGGMLDLYSMSATTSMAWPSHLTTSPLSSLPSACSDSSHCQWAGPIKTLSSMMMSPTSYNLRFLTLWSLTSMMSLSVALRCTTLIC